MRTRRRRTFTLTFSAFFFATLLFGFVPFLLLTGHLT